MSEDAPSYGNPMPDARKRISVEDLFGDEFLRAVGLFFVVAGSAEHSLALQFARLVAHPNKLDPAMVAALGYIETRAQLQQIRIIARWRLAPETFQEAMKICDQLKESFERRNELAHWVYMPGADPDRAVLKTIRIKWNGSVVPEKPYTAQQIREFAETLLKRLNEFDRVLTGSGLRAWDPADFDPTLSPKGAGDKP